MPGGGYCAIPKRSMTTSAAPHPWPRVRQTVDPELPMGPAGPQWETQLQQRPVGQHSLLQARFGGLMSDRVPTGSPVTELLVGCRARFGVST